MTALFNVISNEEANTLTGLSQKRIDILNTETDRLQQKKDNIVSLEQNAKRMILLNQTYRDKQKQYLILLMIFILVFAAFAIVIFVQERLKIQQTTLDIILMIIASIGFMSAYFTYLDIISRDNIDFQKLESQNGALVTPEKIKERVQEAEEDGKISEIKTNTGCSGKDCCTYDSRADYDDAVAAGNAISGATYYEETTDPSTGVKIGRCRLP